MQAVVLHVLRGFATHQADRTQQQQHIVGRRHSNKRSVLLMTMRARSSSPPTLLCGAGETTAARGGEEDANQRRAAAAAAEARASSGGAFPVTRAAVDAARAVGKSHLDHVVDRNDRWRLEREAFRIRVQKHVGRELGRKALETTGALASVVDAEGKMSCT